MTWYPGVTAVCAALLLAPGLSRAQVDQGDPTPEDGDTPTVVAADMEDDGEAPAVETYAPPAAEQAATPDGQWVDTQQYGRIWMPYSDAYTYAPPDGYGEPYEYVYYPSYGWTWVVAPWIWGWGPWPTFGVIGPARFGWFCQGWWRTPSRFHFGPSFRSVGSFRGPGSPRGGVPGHVTRPPAFRGTGAPSRFSVRGGAGFGGRTFSGGHAFNGQAFNSHAFAGHGFSGHGFGGHVSGGHASGGHVSGGHASGGRSHSGGGHRH